MPQRLRVFISSPGDVEKERLRAGLIIDKMAQEFSRFFSIEGYLWEHEPMLSSAHFQDAIEPPSSFDVVVLIVWSRLGTPLPEHTTMREYRGIDGRAPVTGTEWEYEDALRSAQAKGVPDLMVFRNISNAPIDTRNPEARAAAVAQMSALDTFWKLHFTDRGTFRYAYDEYDTLEKFAARFEETLRKVIERRIETGTFAADAVAETKIWPGDPFRGLDSYEFDDAPIFFGREAQITKATEQLAANAAAGTAFLLVSGASGSGKSSLVKAAVVPRLMKPQRITGAAFLRRAVFRAGAGGADPFLGLAQALTRADKEDMGLPELIEPGQDASALAAHLRGAAGSPGYAFGNALGRLTRAGRAAGKLLAYEEAKLILVVDQLEELFTAAGIDAETRGLFIDLLGGLARSGHVWVIATMRADFWHRASEIPALLALAAGEGRIDLAAPSPAEQAEIIRKPAMAAGLTFELHPETRIGLDAVLAQDAAAAPGVLPLLSFTLNELYQDAKRRNSSVLTHASYEALDGLRGAIAKRAEETVNALPADAQAALPAVLRRLVTVTAAEDRVLTSRAAPLESFLPGTPARRVIDALIAARLLVADERAAVPTVRLAHEALIERWQRARDQFAAERRDLESRRIVEEQYKRWREAEHGRQRLLLHNPDLASAVDLARRWGDELSAGERDYIRRSRNRARLAQTLTAAAAVIFALVAVAAVFEGWRAQQEQREAETNYRLALAQAAGSADILNRGFIEGAINSRLMAELVKRGQDTVSKLPAVSDDVSAARAKLLIAMSPAMTAVGDTGKAREYAGAATQIVADLLRRDPNKFEWRRLHAEAHAALGIAMFWDGDADGTQKENELAIREFKELAAIAPDDLLIPEKLMGCYENAGDTARGLGDFTAATAAYTEWLTLANALADRMSDRAQADFWRSYAADAHLRLGDMQEQQKNYAAAAAEYRAGLAIASLLHADDPGNAKFLEHLSLGHGKLGDALISSDDLDQAMKEIDQNISLTDSLVNDLSANIRWLLYQEWAHLRKGHALLALKRYPEAYAEFALYLKGVEGMRARDPGYISALYDQANAHQWMGDALRLEGKPADAEEQYRQSLQIALDGEKRSPPSNQAAKKILAMAYFRLGLNAEMARRSADAAAAYRECAAISFNSATWTPRSNLPEDVTQACHDRLAQLGQP